MRDLSCLNTIILDDLAAHIDLTSLKSWDLNPDLIAKSLTKWSGAYSSDLFLYDFGLTGFDNGRVSGMTDSLTISENQNKLELYRIGYNNATGGTFYSGYDIIPITGQTVGNYFRLNGGYLQGFFKLNGYNYQTLPYRYAKGVTYETILNLEPASFNDGYFLFLGARAEDKYIPEFSGECVTYTGSTTVVLYGSKQGYEKTITEKLYSGVTTSLDNHLNSLTTYTVAKKAIQDQHHTEDIQIENLNNDIDNNVIGFYLSSEGKIGYTKFDGNGILQTEESSAAITITGWTIIDVQFKPYEIITDKNLLDCAPLREGDLNVFVNGRLFWKIKNFTEFYFRGFKNSGEKQLGVPYNVSWGGGSFGLQHSYHWDLNERIILDENSLPSIGSGYTFVNNPTIINECPPDPISGFTQYVTITGDNSTFVYADTCDSTLTTPNTVLSVSHTPSSAMTTNEYYIEYNEPIELISNRDYSFTVNFYERDIFHSNSTGECGMFFYGGVDIHVLEENVYLKSNNLPNNWKEIKYKIRLKDNSNIQNIRVGFYVKSNLPLNGGFQFYFDKFKIIGSDKLIQDNRKQNERVQKTFDKSFIGGIQKLRIYDNALTVQEIMHNALIESKNNLAYNLNISKGGRLIYE